MKPYNRSATITLSILLGLSFSQIASAQPSDILAAEPHVRLSTEEIVTKLVQRNLERAETLGAYQGTRIYRLEYRGFPGSRTAEMTVDVKYSAPGTKDFSIRSEEGSKLIIDRVFKRMLQSTPSGLAYILSVEPRTNDKLLYRGCIWVDAEDFAVMRIDAVPAKNPSFWTKETRIEQTYAKVGDFWLPLSNRSTSSIRLGGHASFTIDYQDYQITSATAVGTQRKVAGYR